MNIFFQAEDGIRDGHVTGVQTCALPILNGVGRISYIKVLEQIKKEHIPPVLLLYGTESYFIQNIQDKLFANLMKHSGDENISTYDLEETPIQEVDRKSTRLNSSHVAISYAVFCLK